MSKLFSDVEVWLFRSRAEKIRQIINSNVVLSVKTRLHGLMLTIDHSKFAGK